MRRVPPSQPEVSNAKSIATRCGVLVVVAALTGGEVRAQQDRTLEAIAAIANVGHDEDLPERGPRALSQAVRDAQNDRLIAIVATHPDDQYVLPATYLRLFQGYRVAAVLVTRGEGGQNSSGPQIGDELGRWRTLETETCANRLGLRVHYLNRLDAGYCRTANEAFDVWGRRSTTEELARVLRTIRPDVVMTTHHPAETHGHDLALIAILADAVALSADPEFEASGTAPIRLPRLFRGATPTEDDGYLILPCDKVDPERNSTYRQLAYQALTESHRSQAPFRTPADMFGAEQRFVPVAVGDRAPRVSLYEGLPDLFRELELSGVVGKSERDRLRSAFERELISREREHGELTRFAISLRDRLLGLDIEPGSSLATRVTRRTRALERVVQHALGLELEVDIESIGGYAVPGESLALTITVRTNDVGTLRELELTRRDGAPIPLESIEQSAVNEWTLGANFRVGDGAAARTPLARLYELDTFDLPLRAVLGFALSVDEAPLGRISVPFDIPTDIRPALQIELPRSPLLIPDDVESLRFNVVVRRNSSRQITGDLVLRVPAGFVVEPSRVPLDLATESTRDLSFELHTPEGLRSGIYTIHASLSKWGTRVPLRRVNVAITPDLRIGVIEGVDGTASSVLDFFEADVERLDDTLIESGDLDRFDTILIDIRALRHRHAARASMDRLTQFAERGGRLVVLYHKDAEFNFESTGIRAFPPGLEVRIGKGRVTREDAPVRHNLPEHSLLNRPNRIELSHWDGWVQERGLYFPAEVSDAFERILRMNDPDYPPEDTSLIYARTGARGGEYVLCSLALYRQLRNLHPGACRLLANIVSRPNGTRDR